MKKSKYNKLVQESCSVSKRQSRHRAWQVIKEVLFQVIRKNTSGALEGSKNQLHNALQTALQYHKPLYDLKVSS